MALSRRKLSLETAPTGKKLEEVKKTMLRVHRAAGHPWNVKLGAVAESQGSTWLGLLKSPRTSSVPNAQKLNDLDLILRPQ